MAIDFSLTPQQKELQRVAREFSLEVLKPLIRAADAEPDPQKGFQMVKPAYEKAYELGFATGFLPEEYGGGGLTNVDVQIAAEEISAVDPGFACILLVNGLALMPVVWYASEEQKEKWLTEACNDPTHSYLAGWVVSEPAGSPGGTANFDHPDPKAGIQLIAERDGDEYVLNGRKYWPSSAGGWDLQGANANTVIVRTDRNAGGKTALSAIMVPRGTDGVRVHARVGQDLHGRGQGPDHLPPGRGLPADRYRDADRSVPRLLLEGGVLRRPVRLRESCARRDVEGLSRRGLHPGRLRLYAGYGSQQLRPAQSPVG